MQLSVQIEFHLIEFMVDNLTLQFIKSIIRFQKKNLHGKGDIGVQATIQGVQEQINKKKTEIIKCV